EYAQLPLGELAPGRHLLQAVLAADRLDEQAGLRTTGPDRRPTHAALLPTGPGIQAQAALLLVGAVAADAVLHQERAHFLLEGLVRGRKGGVQKGADDHHRNREPTAFHLGTHATTSAGASDKFRQRAGVTLDQVLWPAGEVRQRGPAGVDPE